MDERASGRTGLKGPTFSPRSLNFRPKRWRSTSHHLSARSFHGQLDTWSWHLPRSNVTRAILYVLGDELSFVHFADAWNSRGIEFVTGNGTSVWGKRSRGIIIGIYISKYSWLWFSSFQITSDFSLYWYNIWMCKVYM